MKQNYYLVVKCTPLDDQWETDAAREPTLTPMMVMAMRFIILTPTERSPLKNITRRTIHEMH